MKRWLPWMIAILATALIVCSWLLVRLVNQPEASTNPPSPFAIVNARGHEILSADQIEYYDWPTHTMKLRPGAIFAPHSEAGEGLCGSGIPFSVVVNGEVCYRGVVTSSLSSVAHSGHVIMLHWDPDDIIKISFGYPSSRPNPTTPDLRSDPRVREALKVLGKLQE